MCGVIIKLWIKDARAVSVHVRHASVEVQVQCVNVVIGVVLGELHVARVVPVVVCDDAVVRRTLVLIAFIVAIVFIVAILRRILLYWRCSVYNDKPFQRHEPAASDVKQKIPDTQKGRTKYGPGARCEKKEALADKKNTKRWGKLAEHKIGTQKENISMSTSGERERDEEERGACFSKRETTVFLYFLDLFLEKR